MTSSERESWSEFLDRAANAIESAESDGEHGANTLTEDHIQDVATVTARKTADELEGRLR